VNKASLGNLALTDIESRQQPVELGLVDVYRLVRSWCWPLEATFFEASIIEPKAVGIPKENFDFIARAVTENESSLTERIHVQYIGDDE
jgi:hypothetical protein